MTPPPTPTPTPDAHTHAHVTSRALLFTLTAIAVAFGISILFDLQRADHNPFDRVAYPLMLAGVAALLGLLIARPRTLPIVTVTTVTCSGLFFLSKLIYLLNSGNPDLIKDELAESFFWLPGVYVLSFFVPFIRAAQIGNIIFLGGVTLTAAAYAFTHHRTLDLELLNALIQLSLANLTFFGLARLSHRLSGHYARLATHTETLQHLASTDPLTGLPNRLHLERVLQRALHPDPPTTDPAPFSVVYIDLDGFKLINDTLGHEAGDHVLIDTASRLRSCCRAHDIIARISGDEFVAYLPGIHQDMAEMVAYRFLAALEPPFTIDGQVTHLTASLGISAHPDHGHDAAALLRHADSAMYRVKSEGRNGVGVYTPDSGEREEHHRRLARDLRVALDRQEFTLAYQPIVDLPTGRTVKVEALLRWTHPTHGPISPMTFIPLAEANGSIVPLGTWVLNEACASARAWQRAGFDVKVCVNVSVIQFSQPAFVATVLQALATHDLPPHLLELELTEGIVMKNVEGVRATLDDLRAAGVGTAVDDFGTGYSSLAYLRDLPIDTLKIDRSFIKDLVTDEGPSTPAMTLVEAIIRVADVFGMTVVAEGIETEAQRDALRALGVGCGQGYHFARPLPLEGLLASLKLDQPADSTP
ncbi:putative bifunctional diguanylate cyclase/phosphodiesterase [Deinococcus maricopensis]|uniref:Diguanylate cyclase/phosphodiesterase n=1 Tax=Deinococcus maricopensis (strain DSM 21211 / LMG 22137 / NRRL B-23946 / LB-34) TaxID=709986 RepID=E8U3G4_DEIML|nr:bifunctional diguanylate cyclase/phosphodiesterase [Deinococcus maricopensis]ADV65835.1 diguanylate cyclase/phosphodiesterase [Deinococcus maricopensis DSM 21211]